MDLTILKKRCGRPIAKKGRTDELQESMAFFGARGITAYKVHQILGISMTTVYRIWRTKIATIEKFEMLKNLVEEIKLWEAEHGTKFGG